MDKAKIEQEASSLKMMFETYCRLNRHAGRKAHTQRIHYAMYGHDITVYKEYELCSECEEVLRYSLDRLQTCSFDVKPRCRKCPHPCYEKEYWKKVAKIMRFSGMRLGLIKTRKMIKRIFGMEDQCDDHFQGHEKAQKV